MALDTTDLSLATPFDRLRKRVGDGYSAMDALREDWRKLWAFYRGDGQLLWRTKLPPKLQDDAVATNFVFSSMEQYIATLMQDEPDWYVVALGQEQDKYAKAVTDYLQAFAVDANLNAEREPTYRYALVMGTGVLKVFWDSLARNGAGDVAVRAVDPCDVVVDPTATRIEDCEFVAIRNVYGYALAHRLFDRLPKDPSASGAANIEVLKSSDDEGEIDQPDLRMTAELQVVVWEIYHDFGKRRTVYSGSKLLHEGDNPTPESRFPLVFFPLYPRRKQFWAAGIVEQVRPLQDFFNKLRTRVSIWARYAANPVIVCDDPGAEISTNPGDVIKLTILGANAKYLVPPNMPTDVFRTLDELPGDMDVITGVHDITRGIRPTGTTSGISLEVLHAAARTRLTGPARAWTAAWSQVGQRVLELMQKYYGEVRQLSLLRGSERQRIDVEPGMLSGVQLQLDENRQAVVGEDGEPSYQVQPYEYRVITQPKGDLPLSPAALAEMTTQLVVLPAEDGRPMLDRMAVLNAMKYPNRDEILERMMVQGEAQMQGEMDALQAIQGQGQAQMQGQQVQAAGQGQLETAQVGMEQLTQTLQEMLTPEQVELVRRVVTGEAPLETLGPVYEALSPEGQQILTLYVQAATRGPTGPPGQPGGQEGV